MKRGADMKEYIKLIKLCKYGFRFKLNLICFILFFAIGLLLEVTSGGQNVLGSIYIVLCSMYMYQFIISLSLTDMVQSSGLKYKLNVNLPVIANVVFCFIFYTFVVIHRYSIVKAYPSMESNMVTALLVTAVFIIVLFLYTAFAYKYFIISVIMFTITFSITMGIVGYDMSAYDHVLSYKGAVIIGYAAVIIGGALEYIISRTLYNKPLSERAFRGVFKSQID